MSATAPPSGVPSLKWIAAIGAGAFALFMLGALVVEPALNRLIAPTDLSARPRVSGQVEVGEVVLSGRYVAAKSDMALDVDGGALSTTTGGRLTSAPHRLVQADQQASVSKVSPTPWSYRRWPRSRCGVSRLTKTRGCAPVIPSDGWPWPCGATVLS